jgi:hypothetical protein
LLANQPIEYARVMDQIKILKAKNVADLASLNRQAAIDAQNEANSEAKAWRGAVQEITSAESSFLNDYLTGRKNAGQSAIAIADQTALKEIQNDAAAVTTRLLLANTEEAKKRALEQGGFLYHLLFSHQDVAAHAAAEATKTASTAAGNTARAASDTAGQAGFFGRIAAMIAGWLGFETTKTAETVAGNAAGNAAMVAAGFGQIQVDAAVAAAGAMAATAAIPFIGPELAPAAAAAAYAETMGWAAGLGGGLAQGTNYVPSDMVKLIHEGERVVPKADNAQLMANLAGGGKQSSGPSFGDTNFTNHFHQVAVTPNAVMAAVETAWRNGHPAFRRMARA